MASYLKSVKIPASVTSIGRNAFYHLLKDIYYEGTKEQWNSISIDDSITVILQGATIHYAAGANAPASSFYTIDTDKTIFNIPVNTNGVASTAGIVHVEVIGADNEQKGEGDEEFLNAADGDKVLVNVPCILKVGDIIKIYTSIK